MSQIDSNPHRPRLSWTRVRLALFVVDFIALILALEVSYLARYSLGWHLAAEGAHLDPLVPPLCLAITLGTYRVLDLYSMKLVGSGMNEYRTVVTGTTLAFAGIVIFSYIDDQLPISRAFLLFFWLSTIGFVGTGRFLARRVVWQWSRLHGGLRRILVVGANETGVHIANELASNRAACSTVLGYLSEYQPLGEQAAGHFSVLGEPMELYRVAKRVGATHAVVVPSALSWESLRFIIRSMHASRLPEVLLAPSMFDVAATPLQFTQVGRATLLVPHATRIVGFEAFFKRFLDLCVSVPTLVATVPLQLAICAYLKLAGVTRPLERVRALGFGGGVIKVPRLAGGPRLRANHLARLPSLWLVVTGKMSLVGPRPLLEGDHGGYGRWTDVLTALKPGFIGPWWLSGHGRPATVEDEIEADLNYARTYTIWLDLHILGAVTWTLVSSWLHRPNAALVERLRRRASSVVGPERKSS